MRIVLPVSVLLGKRVIKKYPLNLNKYRNTYHHELNNAKIAFSEAVRDSVKGAKFPTPFIIRYFLYLQSRRKVDVANICSIVDKFFSDVLVEEGVIPDDNYEFLKAVSYEFVEIDKNNPRVEAQLIYIGNDHANYLSTN